MPLASPDVLRSALPDPSQNGPETGANPQPTTDDPRYNKKIIGMEILTDMIKDGDEYDDGEVLDPNNGKIYSCKICV